MCILIRFVIFAYHKIYKVWFICYLMPILDYLGRPTKAGHVFFKGDLSTGINRFVDLSSSVYNFDLHSSVVDELRLVDLDGKPLPEELVKRLKEGDVPNLPRLRSLEYEEKLDSGFLLCRNNTSDLVAACAVCSPVDGYRYSAGRDVHGNPEIDIWFNEWFAQSHIWASPVIDETDNLDLSLANSLMGIRLVQSDGAKRVTFYESIHTPEHGSRNLLSRVSKATNGQSYQAKFPMLDPDDEGKKVEEGGRIFRHTNDGCLYMIELERLETAEELRKVEDEVIQKLWGN